MLLDVRKQLPNIVIQVVALLVWAGAVVFLLVASSGTAEGGSGDLEPLAFLAAIPVAVVAHELGHLLACLAVGTTVRAFRLGTDRFAIRFRMRNVQVSLGFPNEGRVGYDGLPSAGRRALILLAGSLADLVLAGLVLAGSSQAAAGSGVRSLGIAVGLGFAVTGLIGLLPRRSRSGRLSDGAQLLRVRSAGREANWRALREKAGRLRQAGRTKELLELEAGLGDPAERTSTAEAASRALIEFSVAGSADLTDDGADRAERRLELLARRADLGLAEGVAWLALAMLRLRRDDLAAAEQHANQALAVKGVPDSLRRAALAIVFVTRQGRGLPDDDIAAAAAAAAATPDDSLEVTVAHLRAILDPESTLRAFRDGDPPARLGVGEIAPRLLRQGRIGELLAVHAGFGTPAGRYLRPEARSLHAVEFSLLCAPGLPPEVIDQAAVRTQWLLDNYPFTTTREDEQLGLAAQHTLAVARLRQGRFAEVEPLCEPGLAKDFGPDTRATILATIALARRGLGRPYQDLLAEAVALAPDADLVAEARSGAGQPLIGQES